MSGLRWRLGHRGGSRDSLPGGEDPTLHLLKNAREVLEKRYPGQRNGEHRSHLMGMIRGLFTTTSEMEAMLTLEP